jgi:hypothetical protein
LNRFISRLFHSFQTKIIILVLGILILSQSLGTFLSALSFEKILLNTLIAKYDILGKDLKRQIEKSLKFGKNLETFMGMDRLVAPFFKDAPEIQAIYVLSPNGKPYYPKQGKGKNRFDFLVSKEIQWKDGRAAVEIHQGRVHVLLPVKPPMGGPGGLLDLVFDRAIVDHKIQDLIREMLYKLVPILLIASACMGFLIKYSVVRPARKQLEQAGDRFYKDPKAAMDLQIPKEMFEVQLNSVSFVAKTRIARFEMKNHLNDLLETPTLSREAGRVVEQMQTILDKEND